MSEAEQPVAESCVNCKELQQAVFQLTVERQQLLELLAAERVRSNALFVAYPPQEQSPAMPSSQAARHRVVDAFNIAVKERFPRLHSNLKRALERWSSNQA